MSAPGNAARGRATWRYRVFWEDTDAGGVVYHARYLNFMERARSEWLLALGFPQVELRQAQGCLFVVTSVTLDFRAPARLEDELAVDVVVEELRAASMTIGQTIRRPDDSIVAQGRVAIACLAADSFRPVRIPRALRVAINDFQGNSRLNALN